MKTKLAASITKIRIEKQALNLQLLLPVHLRDEKVARAVQTPIITGVSFSFNLWEIPYQIFQAK